MKIIRELSPTVSVSFVWACKRCQHGRLHKGKETPPHTYDVGCKQSGRVRPPEPPDPEVDHHPQARGSTDAAPPVNNRQLGLPFDDPPEMAAEQVPIDEPLPLDAEGPVVDEVVEAPDPLVAPPVEDAEGIAPENILDGDDDEDVAEPPGYVEPSFNIRRIKRELMSDETTDERRLRLILGLHHKFYHAPVNELERMLQRGNYGLHNVKLVAPAVAKCRECHKWARVPHKPVAGIRLSRHFNIWSSCYL